MWEGGGTRKGRREEAGLGGEGKLIQGLEELLESLMVGAAGSVGQRHDAEGLESKKLRNVLPLRTSLPSLSSERQST